MVLTNTLIEPQLRTSGGGPGAALLREAVLWLDPAYSSVGEQEAVNLGTGGAALNARYGNYKSAAVVNGALYCPGIAGNYASIPDSAPLNFTGDIEIVVRSILDIWTPASNQVMLAKRAANAAYEFRITPAGKPEFGWWSAGAPTVVQTAISPPLVNGTFYWFKVTLDVDNGVGGKTVKFYMAADQSNEPTSWTLLDTITSGGTTFIDVSTSAVYFGAGSSGTSSPMAGKFKRGIIRNGIDGTTVADIDFTNVPNGATSFVASTGQTVTVTSVADGADPLLLQHTGENYLYTPGLINNFALVTYSPSMDIVGSVEMVWKGQIGNSLYPVVGRGYTGPYGFLVGPSSVQFGRVMPGPVQLLSAQIPYVSTYCVPGAIVWIKITFDSTLGRTRAYTALNSPSEPTSWNLEGQATSPSMIGDCSTSASGFYFSAGSSATYEGKHYVGKVRNGIDGPVVIDVNFSTGLVTGAETSFVCGTGQTVNITRATTGRKTVAVVRSCWLFGTDDYMEIPDNSLLDMSAISNFTLLCVIRQWDTAVSYGRYVDKKAGGGALLGWSFSNNSTTVSSAMFLGDGTNPVADFINSTAGALKLLGGLVNRSSQLCHTINNNSVSAGTSTAALGTMDNSYPLCIGKAATASSNQDFELMAVILLKRVITVAELAAVNQYYGTA